MRSRWLSAATAALVLPVCALGCELIAGFGDPRLGDPRGSGGAGTTTSTTTTTTGGTGTTTTGTDTTTTATDTAACDGGTACPGGFACVDGACKTACATDGDCASSSDFCQDPGAGGTCVPKATTGAACTAKDQCASGFCVDGLCCDNACAGPCHACSAALTGGVDGSCGAATNGDADPRGLCTTTAPSTCGTDGKCNAGACRVYPAGTACPACSGGNQTTGTCSGTGTGTCDVAMMTACAPYLCGPTACETSCASHNDCVAGDFCWLGSCLKLASVAGGYHHACAITTAGGAQCWGNNPHGELGNGSMVNGSVPVAVSTLPSGVVVIAGGGSHTCAITTGGGLHCWGYNTNGQLGDGTLTSSLVPVASSLSSGVAAIAAGGAFTCALTTAGGVKCWGANSMGQLGNGSNTDSSTPVGVTGLSSGVAAIAAGDQHACALTTGGGVKCWGANIAGSLGDGTNSANNLPVAVMGLSSGIAGIAAGGNHTCALTTGGGVQCWGQNIEGQVGNNTLTDSSVPVAVFGLSSGVAALTAGYHTSCVRTTGGGAQCWGANFYGELGNNTTAVSSVPVPVSGLSSGVAAIAPSYESTCALTTAGLAQCWGFDADGELGDNSTAGSPVPVAVAEP